MKKEDVTHLATLARIKVNDDEANALASDITEILGYVEVINEITGTREHKKQVGPLHSVLREDGEPHEPGIYSEDLLKEAPERDGDYIKVKKILDNNG